MTLNNGYQQPVRKTSGTFLPSSSENLRRHQTHEVLSFHPARASFYETAFFRKLSESCRITYVRNLLSDFFSNVSDMFSNFHQEISSLCADNLTLSNGRDDM